MAAQQHDYHLVDPSPWPIVGSISAFILAVGAIFWMHKILRRGADRVRRRLASACSTPWSSWWRDVINEAEHLGYHTRVVQLSSPLRHDPVHRLRGDVLRRLVLGLFQHRAVSRRRASSRARRSHRHVWPPKGIETFDPWHLPLLNTLILLTSGTTVTWAHHALLEGDRDGLKKGLWLTIVLGALFTCVQAYEYSHAAFNFKGNIYGATFFMATGFHGFHVLVGTMFLIVCLMRAYAGHFSRSSISASNSPPGTGISSTWCGSSCSPASMCGVWRSGRGRRRALALIATECEKGGLGRPFLLPQCRLELDRRMSHQTCLQPPSPIIAAASPAAARAAARASCSRAFSTCGRAARSAGSIIPSSMPATARRSSSFWRAGFIVVFAA